MNEFFLLAGGYGKRAEPLSSFLPKPLFPLNGTPLINLIAGRLFDAGLNKGYVNLFHQGEKIRNTPLPGMKIEYLYEEKLSGNRILKESYGSHGDYLIVINGDTFLDIPFKDLINKVSGTGAEGVLLVRKKDNEYSSILFKGDSFIERDRDPLKSSYMYTGVSVFRKDIVREFREENLFDSLKRIGANIKVLVYDGIWFDMGTPELYFSADYGFRKYYGIKNLNSLSDNVSVSPEAKITNTIIWKNTKLGKGVNIRNCIVTGDITLNSCDYSNKIITPSKIYDLKI